MLHFLPFLTFQAAAEPPPPAECEYAPGQYCDCTPNANVNYVFQTGGPPTSFNTTNGNVRAAIREGARAWGGGLDGGGNPLPNAGYGFRFVPGGTTFWWLGAQPNGANEVDIVSPGHPRIAIDEWGAIVRYFTDPTGGSSRCNNLEWDIFLSDELQRDYYPSSYDTPGTLSDCGAAHLSLVAAHEFGHYFISGHANPTPGRVPEPYWASAAMHTFYCIDAATDLASFDLGQNAGILEAEYLALRAKFGPLHNDSNHTLSIVAGTDLSFLDTYLYDEARLGGPSPNGGYLEGCPDGYVYDPLDTWNRVDLEAFVWTKGVGAEYVPVDFYLDCTAGFCPTSNPAVDLFIGMDSGVLSSADEEYETAVSNQQRLPASFWPYTNHLYQLVAEISMVDWYASDNRITGGRPLYLWDNDECRGSPPKPPNHPDVL